MSAVLESPDYGQKQYHMKRLEGYRACATGIPRERNWYSPVRAGSTDERGWFDGWDLARKDGFQASNTQVTGSPPAEGGKSFETQNT